MSRRTTRQDITAYAYDKKGKLLAVGKNSYTKTHSLQAFYAKKAGKPAAVFLHAEIACLIKAKRYGKIHTMRVERFGARGAKLNCAPCEICRLALAVAGVKHVHTT